MQTVFELSEKPWPIKLEQRASGSFKVTYGYQVDDHLDYGSAAAKLGQAIMHKAACDGLIQGDEQ